MSYEGNDLVEEIYESRNYITNQLENSTRYIYEYQIIGDVKVVVNILTYEWQNEWVLEDQVNLTYYNGVISGGTYTSVTYPEDNETFTVTSVNDSTFITSFIEVGGELVPDYREIYPNITPEVLFSTFFGLDTYEIILPNYLFEFEFPDVIEQSFISNEWENDYRITSEKIYDQTTEALIKKLINEDYWDGVEWLTEFSDEGYYSSDTKVDSIYSKSLFEGITLETLEKEYLTYDGSGNLVLSITEDNYSGVGFELSSKSEFRWTDAVSTSIVDEPILTKNFYLSPAYPNPFNPTTNIQYTIEQATSNVSIRVYDMLGRQVAILVNGPQMAGSHTIKFDAANLSSGIYYVSMVSGQFKDTRSITLLK